MSNNVLPEFKSILIGRIDKSEAVGIHAAIGSKLGFYLMEMEEYTKFLPFVILGWYRQALQYFNRSWSLIQLTCLNYYFRSL
jgi:hypothetical protein